ncbi:hypothetical protein DXA23_04595 [Phocaeicola vulgatus]|nr:hypothetical protein DXA23_04595 [Phocaeicola vulgatus]
MVKGFLPACFISASFGVVSISFGVNSIAWEITPKAMEIEYIRIKRFNLKIEKAYTIGRI